MRTYQHQHAQARFLNMSRRITPGILGKWYLCGPMTGYPSFNIPAFEAAAERLRASGFEIVSPAELDDPETRKTAMASPDGAPGTGSANGETWGDFLSRDVKLVADGGFDGIVLLPGWSNSSGGLLETLVGFLKKHTFRAYLPEDGTAFVVSTYVIYGEWISGLWRKITS
jgi:hypothetical protein